MHPGLGPQAEARLLYVEQLQLPERVRSGPGEFVIWDIGLGAAANALAALQATREIARPVRLLSFDLSAAPLAFALQHAVALGYFEGYEAPVTDLLKDNTIQFRDGARDVHWQFFPGDFPELLRQPALAQLPPPHAILFDAFSPARNPAMWTLPVFTNLFRRLDPARPCALPTYSRSTLMRVTLLLAGFFVGTGRPSGAKEETTVAANTLDLIAHPLDRRWLDRAYRSHSAEPLHTPEYVRLPLTPESWERLQRHPQFTR